MPAIDRASTHSRLPRVLFVLRTFSLFVLFAMLIGYLGLPPLAREMTRVFKPLQARILQLVRPAIMLESRRNFLRSSRFLGGVRGPPHGNRHQRPSQRGHQTIPVVGSDARGIG